MALTYNQLSKKAKSLADDNYNCIVERKAPASEIKEYYMTMNSGYPILFNSNGTESQEED